MFGFSIANPKTTEYAFVLVSFWLLPITHSSLPLAFQSRAVV
jgi:hypothetical protein